MNQAEMQPSQPTTGHRSPRPHRTTALLLTCPWSGDDNDPIPRTYPVWFWLYQTTRRLRHRIGLHDWSDHGLTRCCSWCGDRR